LAGKTGTTNNAMDAWFCGYHPDIAGIAWIGFDRPRSLGSRETGGGLALPIWIDFMAHALKDKPAPSKRKVPEGVLESGGEVYLAQFPPGVAMAGLGLSDTGLSPGAVVESAEGDSMAPENGGGQIRVVANKGKPDDGAKPSANPAMDQGLIEAPEASPSPKRLEQ
jgi:membrane carboxypeptidase/penicillin-binding protein